MENFIYNLDEIYKNNSIYRAFIIVNNLNNVKILTNILKNKDYDPIYIDNINNIDKNYRLYIILLDNIYIIKSFDKDEYNLVAVMI